MSIVIDNSPQDSNSLYGIPYTVIQVVLSVLIPLVIFYLGIKAAIKSLKKKELARLIVLKDYYYLWVKDILKDATKQNQHYRKYCIDLYKLDYLSGVQYTGIELTFGKLSSIDDKDLYKIFMELNRNRDNQNAENLIKLSKKLLFIDSAINQCKDEHKGLINYLIELRNDWNNQIKNLHIVKDNIVKAWRNDEVPNPFFAQINLEFNQWYDMPGYSGLKETYNFVKRIERISKVQYSETPSTKVVSDLLFSVQNLANTYMMFHVYRLEIFKKFKYYYKSLESTISDVNRLIEDLKDSPIITWDRIKSYQ